VEKTVKDFQMTKKNSLILEMLVLALGSMLAGCVISDGNNMTDLHAAYYGTWEKDNNTLIISANKMVLLDTGNVIYTLEPLTWTVHSNGGATAVDYPSGYAITGTVTYKGGDDYFPNKPGTIDQANKDELAVDYWYIHRDGQSLVWGDWNDNNHFGMVDKIYIKQP
jgi:hypothetical protein